jgi:predicted secreted hydrolase
MSLLRHRAGTLVLVLLAPGLALLLAACPDKTPTASLDVGEALGGVAAEGFARADSPRRFRFPEDHASHPDFRNEWWYFTGHLEGEQGQRFGYQLTLFRIALAPGAPQSESAWATHQVWMGHAALTDVDAGQHRHAERYARGAAGLAGQAMTPFRVWLEDWQISGAEDGRFPWQLRVESDEFALDLEVSPRRAPVLQGDRGLSQKSAAAGNASYYYSLTRLATRGEIRSGDQRYRVQGLSWLDREWSTSALGDDQAGWDWFSLQLDSGADLMLYRLRRKDGSTDPHSAGKWVTADAQDETLGAADFRLRETRFWASPETGRRYPVAWTLESGGRTPTLEIEAVLDAQEMRTAVTYWEGAVWVRDAASGERIGRGYLEMTGY